MCGTGFDIKQIEGVNGKPEAIDRNINRAKGNEAGKVKTFKSSVIRKNLSKNELHSFIL